MKHVEGLRGLAIISVLLFHINGVVWKHGWVPERRYFPRHHGLPDVAESPPQHLGQ